MCIRDRLKPVQPTPLGEVTPEHDCWIIFTSGSTGKPKGVAVTHRSAAAFVDAEARMFCQDNPLGPDDRVLAGATFAEGEWTLVLRGEPVASTPSAAMLIAMLRHTAASRHAQGIATRLSVSKALDAAASAEAAAEGRTLTEHLDWLEAERRTRKDPPAAAPLAH